MGKQQGKRARGHVERRDPLLSFLTDLLYPSLPPGGDTLTPREAISFLHVQQSFTFGYCSHYETNAIWALLAWGFIFRLLAYLKFQLTPMWR
jgi:hypothetical protein